MHLLILFCCALISVIFLITLAATPAYSADVTADLSARLHAKLQQSALVNQFQKVNAISNLEHRMRVRQDLISLLTQEELAYLVEAGILDSFVDFVVSTANGAADWVESASNAVAEGFMSKVAGPVAGWSASALGDTKTWATGTYTSSESGLNSFATDVQNGLKATEKELNKAFVITSDFVAKSQVYLTSGGFENDLKRIGGIIKGAVLQVCGLPGAQSAMRIAIGYAIKAAVCAATEMQGPGCGIDVPLKVLGARALKVQVIKCAAFGVLDELTGLCAGRNDWIADILANVAVNSNGYDMMSYAVVGCVCGGCPGTCAYSNRQVCSGKWWISSATELVAAVGLEKNVPGPGPVNVFGDIVIVNAWYGQSVGNGGMDVTAHFCEQLKKLGSNVNSGQVVINNKVIGGDPTPQVAKAFFVTFKLKSRPDQLFMFHRPPVMGENYGVGLSMLTDAVDRVYPGTFVLGMTKVRVLRAWWCAFNGDPHFSWTDSDTTWPAGWDLTGQFWSVLASTGNNNVPLKIGIFGDYKVGELEKMIMVYQKDEGFGYGRIGVYAGSEGAVVTASSFPSLKAKFKILSAFYGAQDDYATAHGAWVQDILNAHFALKDAFLINNDNLNGDPAVGKLKLLMITYLLDGQQVNKQIVIKLPDNENRWLSVSEF